jgi:cytochrome c553
MSTIAKDLSDEEIQALATYIEGLHAAAPAP